MKKLLSSLPKIDKILQDDRMKSWTEELDLSYIKESSQIVIDSIRQGILDGSIKDHDSVEFENVIKRIEETLSERLAPSLKPVINATGTVLHTNLGRAPLSQTVIDAIIELGPSYSNLEYDLVKGKRGSRYNHLKDVLIQITGAEDALVVNNNAAAVLLMLSALTEAKEVVISRGELVEIGGSFRIPDVITRGGALLHEVGATNKTHLKDYQTAINENTGALLKVHTSNYQLVGFTDKVDDHELVDLAHQHNILALNDLGSGLFMDMQAFGLPYEPTVQEAIQAGYDVVTFSGDKLLGGPQAGIIVGKKALLDKMRVHPLTRALRTDKLTLAALEVTMRQYLNPELALEKIPVLQMVSQRQEELIKKAEMMQLAIQELDSQWQVDLIKGQSQVGGGSYPGTTLPTILVQIDHPTQKAAQIESYLRALEKPVIARVHQDHVQFDVRTLSNEDIKQIVSDLDQLIK
ncbi:L-seryl-tRNA(Sec) selenium transferase [Facklamia miroungae]|uniref:L-seryl-tRNA(Sec) selenium transferase n=1 Tax=Facklamia miroungae TaxID=120956 RepID=A0A1G7QQW7_9LACT|nr:L-seryl-tRNA(Sec) selenium transferase [Facklamia miroungae]NKZ29033.1 L-seryl-tRNA(Sec) selenium transferase [Facklamia miroungae]SDG00936.1 L-seryl-tRNA(Ser) seleniumtransferase [Facklamia miroungae]